ncbi:MAG: TraB/GumN family protein, partial [Bacteroidota bacterium]|nr:TraB/GumN family protein [Bacteroidota bacterium]
MKKMSLGFVMVILTLATFAQKSTVRVNENTLLWKISGNGLHKPSYLFGTIHMLCADDALLSDSLKNIIRRSDQVYLEVDMDNILEMIGLMTKMKM